MSLDPHAMRVVPVAQLLDNYAYLVIDSDRRVAAVVDVAEAATVLDAAREAGVRIVAILSTHHHFDHVGGNEELIARLSRPGLRVFGYVEDQQRIPGMTDPLEDGEAFEIGSLQGCAMFIPAHTRGHLAYYFEQASTVFTGDTLFAGGCGRLFEGDAAQMKASLERLAALPDGTRVYCGHEYTRNNLAFAATLEPSNQRLAERRAQVDSLLAEGKPSLPTTIAVEKATNPFLRTNSAELRASLRRCFPGLEQDDVAVFAAVRKLKDEF